MLAMFSDRGWKLKGEVWGDASVALGIIHRRGLGKTWHIDTGHFWIQEAAAKERFKFNKILGKANPADVFTKHPDEKANQHHVDKFAYRFNEGRADEAPKLHALSQSPHEYHDEGHGRECEWIEAILKAIDTSKERRQSAWSEM